MNTRAHSRRAAAIGAALLLLAAGRAMAQVPDPHPLYMWQTGTEAVEMYLLGSIHVLHEEFYPLPDPILDASDRAGLLVLEVDLSQATETLAGELLGLFMQTGYYTDGQTVEEHLSRAAVNQCKAQLKTVGLPWTVAQFMRPWLMALVVQDLMWAELGFSGELGLDQHLLARHGSRDVEGLEDLSTQIHLLAGLTPEQHVLMLEATLAEQSEMLPTMERYVNAWRVGDTTVIAEDLEPTGDPELDAVTHRLVEVRNHDMARRAAELLETRSGTILVVAGAAHFAGDTAVQELLREMGYRVDRVMSDGALRDNVQR